MKRQWKAVPGYEGYYQISNMGRVRSLDRKDALGRFREGKVLSPHDSRGYHRVELNKNGVAKKQMVHRLVAMAFHGPPPPGHVSNHLNGKKKDNRPENLEWVTHKENDRHSRKTLGNHGRGEDHPLSALTKDDVIKLRKLRKERVGRRLKYTLRELGEVFGVSLTTVKAAISGQNWGWLNDTEPPSPGGSAQIHARGSKHPNAKLDEHKVKHIRSLYATGDYSLAELGRMYGVTYPTISHVVKRKTWRHVE